MRLKFTKIQIDIVIRPEGKGKNKIYSASAIQIPNVVTQGKTLEEAQERLREALNLYFEEVPQERTKIIKTIEKENNPPLISRMCL